jgi:hypothetical protein
VEHCGRAAGERGAGPFSFWLHDGRGAVAAIQPKLVPICLCILLIDIVLFVFNVLPIYPLDGGQMLRSVLWFVIGRARSLMVATSLGFIGLAALLLYAFRSGSVWLVIIAVFLAMNCWAGLKHSVQLWKLGKLPHHAGFQCPSCHAQPPAGRFWSCPSCRTIIDAFESGGACSYCGHVPHEIPCVECGRPSPIDQWMAAQAVAARS